MRTLSIVAPLPPGDCSQNAHTHWRNKHKASAPYREHCSYLFRQAAGKSWQPSRVRLSFVFWCGKTPDKRYRPLDCENALASVKPMIDGFVDAGMCKSDSYRWVTIGGIEIRRTVKDCAGRAEVVVTVEEVS